MESILNSVKKLLGIDPSYTHFDIDLIMHINSVFMVLRQLGVGPSNGYNITGKYEIWTDFINDVDQIPAVKTYVYQKVRLIFDPPSSSAHMEALKNSIAEFEYRLYVDAEFK